MGAIRELHHGLVRHDAYVRRYVLRRQWRVLCTRCKALNEGPYSSYDRAELRAWDESHRKAPACSR